MEDIWGSKRKNDSSDWCDRCHRSGSRPWISVRRIRLLPLPSSNPSICPTMPRGLGTGHSLPLFSNAFDSFSICKNVANSSSTWEESRVGIPLCVGCTCSGGSAAFLLRFRILRSCCPSEVITVSESASVRRGAGQGKM